MALKTWLIVLEIMFSELSAKKGLNTLNEIKNAEIIKYKRRTLKQKELLNLFNDLLDTILTDKTLRLKSHKEKTLMSSKEDDDNEHGKTLMSSKEDDGNENDKTLISLNEDNQNDKTLMSSKDGNGETMNQNNNNIKQLNNYLDEITYKSKSFEDQIKSIKK